MLQQHPSSTRFAFSSNRTGRFTRYYAFLTLLSVSSCIGAAIGSTPPFAVSPPLNKRQDPAQFDWNSVQPSPQLNWQPCYGQFMCARLSVPLDYANPEGDKAAVALLKLPAAPSSGYRGPILFNPGGPGGSGTDLILSNGQNFRTILGDDFDLIGFDPRGVGFTTPLLDIFPSPIAQATWIQQRLPVINTSVEALGLNIVNGQILGDLAVDRSRVAAEHMSTPIVARDMLSIVKAHGRDKLLYWGISYGTLLGATYAAMFPDNIERLLLDGVADGDDYYTGQALSNLQDTDGALFDIYNACVAAGPSACPIHESSTSLIDARVQKILDNLKVSPLAHHNATESTYGIVDISLARVTILDTLHTTHNGPGAALTVALAELEKGNASPMWELSLEPQERQLLTTGCKNNNTKVLPSGQGVEYFLAIACGDSGPLANQDVPALQNYLTALSQTSQFADVWARLRTWCAGWKITPVERFTEKFTGMNKNTSFPIMLIGNTFDPVTPLASAKLMSKSFQDSVVLTLNASGHASIAATSLCTVSFVRDYFRNGTLPPAGTICQPDSSIFGGNAPTAKREVLSDAERKLLQAAQNLQSNYFVPKHF